MTESTPPAARPNPYIGPRSFQTGETLYGREREAQDLLGLLVAERIVLLHSPSGAGKTSLLQAALIPLLIEREFRVLPVMRVGIEPPPGLPLGAGAAEAGFRTVPGADLWLSAPPAAAGDGGVNRYALSLLLALEEALPPEQQRPLAELAALSLDQYLAALPASPDTDGDVLIIDQFEEVLTADATDQATKAAFFAQLGAALQNRNRWALFAMREDYVASLAPYVRPIPTRLATTFRLGLLSAAAAREAMQAPARALGVAFDDAAAERLADDLRRVYVQRPDGSVAEQPGPAVEPVQLQVVCYRLWERLAADATRIGLDDLAAAGDVSRALSDYYAEQVASTAARSGVSERAIRDWFARELITPQGIRGQVLMGAEQSQGLRNAALPPLIDAYLVRAERRRGATWLELAHDRLIAPVRESNAAWTEANLSALQRQAELWQREGRPAGLLLRADALADAERWAEAHADELTPTERDFLALCRDERERERRERLQARRIRQLAVAATLVSIVALIAFIVALLFFGRAREQEGIALSQASIAQTQSTVADTQRGRAEQQTLLAEQRRQEAERQQRAAQARALAAAAVSSLQVDPQRSLLLATAAISATRAFTEPVVPEAQEALQRAAQASRVRLILGVSESGVQSAAWSPDGALIATAGNDGALSVWDASAGAQLGSAAAGDALNTVRWSPDGSRLLTAGSDGLATIWDASTLAQAAELTHDAPVSAAAWSPDGALIATTTADGALTIWDGGTAAQLRTFSYEEELRGVAWSPDVARVAAGSANGSLVLWEAGDEAAEPTIMDTGGAVDGVAWSPDGTLIASANDNLAITVWGADTGELAHTLKGHASSVYAVAWSPDGAALASASADGTAKVWSLADERAALTLYGHGEAVTDVRFSPDGAALLTASLDRTARVWDMRLAPPDGTFAVAYSPDGTQLATSGAGGAHMWDVANGRAQRVISDTAAVAALAFSPDGALLATGDYEGAGRLYDLASDAEPLALEGHEGAIARIAWSPNGSSVATASDDATVRVWDTGSGDELLALEGHSGEVFGVAWSPDGGQIASAGFDGRALLWDTASGALTRTLTETAGAEFTAVAFSPDGRALALADENGAVTLLDPATGATIRALQHGAAINDVTFSPDGSQIASAGRDGRVRVWDAATGDALFALPQPAEAYALAWSSDGARIATASADGVARVFPLDLDALLALAQGRTIRTPTGDECRQYQLGGQCPPAP